MRRHRASIVVVCTVIVATAIGVLPAGAARKVKIRLDQIQTIGTHNSYHLPPRSGLPPLEVTNIAQAPLDVQLEDQNVRSFELDAYDGPNFPVFHSLITDEQTTCLTMRECLEVIDTWSRKHRKAVPITILLEPKALPMSPNLGVQGAIDSVAAERGYTNWDIGSLGRLDALVRRVFGKRLLTPDDVRGKYKTLREAIIDRGWPSLKTSRGKIVVALNTGDPLRKLFLRGHTTLEDRAMFVTARAKAPSAAVVKRDDPTDVAEIQELVRQGFLVRTRADEEGREARLNDPERRTNAFRSGAQIVSTDYPVPDRDVSAYVVRFPSGRPARCNPVSAPKGCRGSDLPEGSLRPSP